MAQSPFSLPFGPSPDHVRVVVDSGGGPDASFWISVAGACIAALALGLTLWRDYNDRPRLFVGIRGRAGGISPEVRAHVANIGRRPATVGPLTLLWDLSVGHGDLPPRGEIALEEPEERHVLEPGQAYSITWPIPSSLPVHEGTPWRAAVYVTGGKRVLSEPLTVLARAIRAYPHMKALLDVPDTPLERPLRCRRLVSRWKVWRPRHLRTEATDPMADMAPGHESFREEWLAAMPRTPDWSRPAPGRGTWFRPE
jgi:hypothetical protein